MVLCAVQHDSKSTPQWVPSNSPSSYGILIHGEAVLQQQREFATLQNQSPSSVTSSHSGLSASGRNSPASFDSFAPGSHEPAVERRTTRPRNRSRSRSGKESSGRSAGRWTADEEEKLRDGHDQFGDDWQAISMHCFGGREGRTAEQCQARWEKVRRAARGTERFIKQSGGPNRRPGLCGRCWSGAW